MDRRRLRFLCAIIKKRPPAFTPEDELSLVLPPLFAVPSPGAASSSNPSITPRCYGRTRPALLGASLEFTRRSSGSSGGKIQIAYHAPRTNRELSVRPAASYWPPSKLIELLYTINQRCLENFFRKGFAGSGQRRAEGVAPYRGLPNASL